MSKKYTGKKQDLEAIFTKEKNPDFFRKIAKYITILAGAVVIAGTIGVNDLKKPDDPNRIQTIETIYEGAIKRLQIIGMSNKEFWSAEDLRANKSKYKFSQLKELEKGDYDEILFINSAYEQSLADELPIKAKKIKLVNSILIANDINSESLELSDNSTIESGKKNILYLQTKNINLYNSTLSFHNSGIINANNIFCKDSIIRFSEDSVLVNANSLALDSSQITSRDNTVKFNINDITLYKSLISSANRDLVIDTENMQLKTSVIRNLHHNMFINTSNNMALNESKLSANSNIVIKAGNVMHLNSGSIVQSKSDTAMIEAAFFEIFNNSYISGADCIVKGERISKDHIKIKNSPSHSGKIQLTNEHGTFVYENSEKVTNSKKHTSNSKER